MQGKIRRAAMTGFQSWEELEVELSDEALNVFIADNETGKSVLFKVFRMMCFPGFWGRDGRKVLLRRGFNFGYLTLETFEGYVVVFIMHKTFSEFYLIKGKPNGSEFDFDMKAEDTQHWVTDVIPDEILTVLNWYVDKEAGILLNLIDQEQSMPFIETTSTFNARLLTFITEHEELETAKRNVLQWYGRLEEVFKNLEKKTEISKRLYESYPLRDTAEMEKNIKLRKRLQNRGELLLAVYDELTTYKSVLQTKGNLKASGNEILENLKDMQKLVNCMKGIGVLVLQAKDLVKYKSEIRMPSADVVQSVGELKCLIEIQKTLNTADNLTKERKELKQHGDDISKEVDKVYDEYKSTLMLQRSVCDLFNCISGMKKAGKLVMPKEDLDKLIALNDLDRVMSDVQENLTMRNNCKDKHAVLADWWGSFLKQNPMCPTCKKPW